MKQATIYIDGKQISTFEGQNLLQVARDNGINIPGLCYHRKISPTGACRLCVVKIEGFAAITTACSTTVKDGMKVVAFDEELEQARRQTLAYLVAEIDTDYDETYFSELEPLLHRYNLKNSDLQPFKSLKYQIPQVIDDSSPVLIYDSHKCIKCFRCVKACDEVQGKGVLSMVERGINSYIAAGFGNWEQSECDGCGECIQLCPTGAIVEKPYKQKVKVNELKSTITTCPYCGVGCQTKVYTYNNEIIRVDGVEGVLPNDGRLCVKGRFGYQYSSHSARLKKPLIKRNGKFYEATWDEALDYVAQRFVEIRQKYGTKALAGYSSAKCTNEENYIFQKFIRIAFGNNNVDYCTRLCHASTVAAMIRSLGDGAGSNSIEDFETTDCLIVIGNNMIETHPITATYVKRGKRRGQKLIVIDPKITPLAKYADIVLQPRLATDVALLNGMMYVVIQEGLINENFIRERIEGGMEAFEELKNTVLQYTPELVEQITGVPYELYRQAAITYATAPTAMIATGMGMSQQTIGTNNVFSLLNLMLITGQIGRERCGINPPRGQNNVQGATDVGASPVFYPGYIPVTNEDNRRKVAQVWGVPFENLDSTPGLTTLEIMDAAYSGQVKAMYIMGENPIITDPHQAHTIEALEKLEFLVVQDIFHTETTSYADVILPAASLYEKDGTVVNSDRRVLRIRKAIEAPGEARPDWQITLEIARRMGYPIGTYTNEQQIWEEIRKVAPILSGITYQRIENQGIQWPCYDEQHPGTSTLYLQKFNTPSGKAKLFPVHYTDQSEKPSAEFPIVLNSGRLLFHYHSATMSRKSDILNKYINRSYILINPNDAQNLGIEDEDTVRVISIRGQIETTAIISDTVLKGEAFMPWHFHESAVNALTRNEKDPISKIAPFKYSAIRIEKIVK